MKRFKLNLKGYIKYRIFEHLLGDMCNNGDCLECEFGSNWNFGECKNCGADVCGCWDIWKNLRLNARKVWGVE